MARGAKPVQVTLSAWRMLRTNTLARSTTPTFAGPRRIKCHEFEFRSMCSRRNRRDDARCAVGIE